MGAAQGWSIGTRIPQESLQLFKDTPCILISSMPPYFFDESGVQGFEMSMWYKFGRKPDILTSTPLLLRRLLSLGVGVSLNSSDSNLTA